MIRWKYLQNDLDCIMPLRVTGDITPVLRHLVKALQPFAKQQGVGLFFVSFQKKLIVSYDPEEMASESITRICREISCAKAKESVILQVGIYKDTQNPHLKISIKIQGCLSQKDSRSAKQINQNLLNNKDREITILDLPTGTKSATQAAVKQKTDNNPSPPGLLPSFYSTLRLHLQSHFNKADNLVALLSVNHPKQAAFLQKIQKYIVDHIEDEDFDVNQLSHVMRMSRTQLFRRLKPLIRQAPAGYIRSIRLTIAKELLETTDLRVGEAASKTGFKTQSHFTQSFMKKYGIKPSLFIRKNKNVT